MTTTPTPQDASTPTPVALLRQQVAAGLARHQGGSELSRLMSDGVDRIVSDAFAKALAQHPVPAASLVALGGYGRRELSPHSDVDLMLLVPEVDESSERLARALFTPLWDAGLEPSSSVRTHDQAMTSVRDDHTFATSLLELRLVAGDAAPVQQLLRDYWDWLHGDRLEAFIAAKTREISERRRKFGGSVYLLEPNVKTGVGGLRDLAGGLWIASARHRIDGLPGVAHYGLLPRREIEQLQTARDTLLGIRAQLHLLSKRRDDRLTFSAQEKLASALGYVDGPNGLAVELLMRDYYLSAQTVERNTAALVERCAPDPHRHRRRSSVPVDDAFELFDGRLFVRDVALLEQDPSRLVRLFAKAEAMHVPVATSAKEAVAHEVERMGPALAVSKPAVDAFLGYLESPGARGEALAGMYEAGLLGGLFPEFARLKGRVQHDVYHVYTVDTHTLFAVQKLLRLRAGEMAAEQPVFTRLAQDLARPLPLLIGMLFHDLGKGMGGDHSRRGEELVRAFGARTGLCDPACIEDAAFLVREHLRLSQVAFRRDLSDPALVDGVAELMGGRERFDMLHLLTYADISSVGPETWNDWRSRLLSDLAERVWARFAEGAASVRPSTRGEAAAASANALRQRAGTDPEIERFVAVLPERYLATVPAESSFEHFELWKRARGRAITGAVHGRAGVSDASELTIVLDDRPGLLAMVAGALAAHSIDILGAEIFSLADGRVLDTFLVREPGGVPASSERVTRALADLEKILSGADTARALIARRRGAGRTYAPGPSLPTKIRFDLSAAKDATVVDVYTRDRVGLLHDIASAIHGAGASIVLARVATEGNRATDGFYLQDADGSKITDQGRLDRLKAALARALDEDGELSPPA